MQYFKCAFFMIDLFLIRTVSKSILTFDFSIISDDDSDNSDRLEAEKLKNDPSYYEEQEQIKLR